MTATPDWRAVSFFWSCLASSTMRFATVECRSLSRPTSSCITSQSLTLTTQQAKFITIKIHWRHRISHVICFACHLTDQWTTAFIKCQLSFFSLLLNKCPADILYQLLYLKKLNRKYASLNDGLFFTQITSEEHDTLHYNTLWIVLLSCILSTIYVLRPNDTQVVV